MVGGMGPRTIRMRRRPLCWWLGSHPAKTILIKRAKQRTQRMGRRPVWAFLASPGLLG